MSIRTTGLKELTNQLDAAARAAKSLDRELAVIEFAPKDSASIENAIRVMESMIDKKLARYADNPLVSHFSERLKAGYRDQIMLRAEAA